MINSSPVIDAHIHIQPFEMLLPAVVETMWRGKANRKEIEALAHDPGALLGLMDEEGIERVGLINYVSPDVLGFTADANDWIVRYASRDRRRLIPFGGVHPRFSNDVK